MERFVKVLLLYIILLGDVFHEDDSGDTLDKDNEGHKVGEESAHRTSQHFRRFVLAKQHILEHKIVEHRSYQSDRDCQGNDRCEKDASGNETEILREIVCHIDFWTLKKCICFLLSQSTLLAFTLLNVYLDLLDDTRNVY